MLAGLLWAHALAAPAGAALFTVTNTNDSGAGSLRDAITSANGAMGPDEIAFALGGCPCAIALASTLTVTDELEITGPGASQLALDGGNAVQVLESSAPLSVSDLTVRKGVDAGPGGGVYASGAPLSLTRVAVQNSSGSYGGGVYSQQLATVVDCTFEANTGTSDGGGLYAPGGLTMSGSHFLNNQVTSHKGYGGGGGLMAFGPTAISASSFVGNKAGDWGGGAYLADFTAMSLTPLTNLEFRGNTAENGGGGGLFVWFDATLIGVDASDNYAGYRGGGIYAGYAGNYGITINGGQVLHNSAAGGGGIYSDGDLSIDGTEVTGNISRNGNGGGVWTPANGVVSNALISGNLVLAGGNSGGLDTGASLTLSNSTLSDNVNFANSGGGSGSGGNVTVTDSQYLGNSTDGAGGGLLSYATTQISNTVFSDNTSGNVGGGVSTHDVVVQSSEFHDNTAGSWGGGIYSYATASVTGSIFTGNAARYAGGGLAIQIDAGQVAGGRFEDNHVQSGSGGAIFASGPTLQIEGTELVGNGADADGGAVWTSSAASVVAALLSGNSAAGNGGAVYAGSDLDLDRARCIDNEANLGGAVFQAAGSGQIENALFARNRALTGSGEALALQPSGVQSIRHSTIASYPGSAGGSAVYVNGGTVELRNSIVASHARGIERDASGAVNADYNLFDGNGVDASGAFVVNDHPIAGAPAFVDPANDDYRLTIGSAAVDAGPSVGVVTDVDGEGRPQGSGFDVGYDELNPAAPTGCPAAPSASCNAAGSDVLQIKVAADPAKDRFALKHLRDAAPLALADFGDPVAGGNVYQLCIYDASAGTPELLASMTVPGGGSCGGKPCWKSSAGKGFQFSDKAATHDGVQKLVLRAGEAGKGAVLVKAAGVGLPLPGPKAAGMPYLNADPAVTAQLHESSTGGCWESRVAAADVLQNTEAQFKAVRK